MPEQYSNIHLKNPLKVLSNESFEDLHIVNGKVSKELKSQESKELNCTNCLIAPGFIDPQINGFGNLNFWNSKPPTFSEIDTLRIELAKTGTVAFCPTIITNSKEKIKSFTAHIKEYCKLNHLKPGAQILGVHIEGVFISKPGVHNMKFSQNDLTPSNIESFIDENVVLFTLAPELDKTGKAIKFLQSNNILISCGHSNATYEEGVRAINEYGINLCTHMFNAMKGVEGFSHRETTASNIDILKRKFKNKTTINKTSDGIMLALLESPEVLSMVIPDGVHVSSEVINYLYEIKGKNNFAITTDFVSTPFFNDARKTGALGGGQTPLSKCIENLIHWETCSIEDALLSASLPLVTKLSSQKVSNNLGFGKISIDDPANLVIWDTEKNKLKGTIIGEFLFLNS